MADDLFREMFFEEARELLETLEKGIATLTPSSADRATVDPVYRAAHSLKGAAAMVELSEISEQAMAMEKSLSQVRSGSAAWTDELAETLRTRYQGLVATIDAEERKFKDSSN